MDPAVALVQAYFYANGYFTVCEYPVIEQKTEGGFRPMTDIDVMAVRFPGARRVVAAGGDTYDDDLKWRFGDPKLEIDDNRIDFVIAEVKEGKAELNRGAVDPAVLRTALARFGALDPSNIDRTVEALIRDGEATPRDDVRIRLFAFGSSRASKGGRKYTVMTLDKVVDYFADLLERRRDILPAAQFKDPALGLLAVLAKVGVREGALTRRG